MSWRTVKLKIAGAVIAVTRTPTTFFLQRPSRTFLHQTSSKKTSQTLLPFPSNSRYTPNVQQYASSPIKSYATFQIFRPPSSNSVANFFTTLQLFDKMLQRGHIIDNTHFSDVIDYVNFCFTKSDLVSARLTHGLVLKVGVLAHLPTSTSLLITYSRAGDFGSSVILFDEIEHKDVIVWNAMMTICIKNQNFGVAIDLFQGMMESGKGFDSTTLVIAISTVTGMGTFKHGQILHGVSVKSGMLCDSFLSNSIIDMYAKCGDLCSSLNMFESMQLKDHVSWNSAISGCLHNDNPGKSVHYFKTMIASEIHDGASLSCAIAASTCLGELDIGQVIHCLGIKLGYMESSHTSVNNAIIAFYSACGHPVTAEKIFRGMLCKDIISWNSMINGFASNQMVYEAFDLVCKMQLEGSTRPDSVTVITVLPLCAELMLFGEGRSIHAYVIRQDMGFKSSVINSLMDFYLKCGGIREAEYLFFTMLNRDLVSWNTIISGYSQNGYYIEAKTRFKEMIFECSWFSLSTLLAILASCCSQEDLKFGQSIHSLKLKLGFSNDILAINAIMFMYINCGNFRASFSLLSNIFEVADVDSWNTLITGCTQNGYFVQALEIFNLMREYNADHDKVTLSNVVSACGNLGLLFEGKLLHGISFKTIEGTDIRVQNALITMYGQLGETESAKLVFRSSHNHNLCSWNCIISALSQNKNGKNALEMFRSLDIGPNEITISSVLSACTQLGSVRHGKEIHAYVFRFCFHTNAYICAALIDTYSNCGRLENALRVFQNLPDKSVAAWNSMISAYGYHNDGKKAIGTFNEMIKYGSKPTKSTFINLLSTCSHLELVAEGQWYYDNMFDRFGVVPETEHQVCLVDMLGRSGRLAEAYEFIIRLPIQPEPGMWGALLSSCGYHGNVEIGKKVAEILFSLAPENVVGYYVVLFNMYAGAGRWSEAAELRKEMEEKGLKKPAGVSLIDVGFG